MNGQDPCQCYKTTESKKTRLFAWYECLNLLAWPCSLALQPTRGLVTIVSEKCLLHWPRIPSTVGPQSPQTSINCASPDFRVSPPGERGAAARWRGGAAMP